MQCCAGNMHVNCLHNSTRAHNIMYPYDRHSLKRQPFKPHRLPTRHLKYPQRPQKPAWLTGCLINSVQSFPTTFVTVMCMQGAHHNPNNHHVCWWADKHDDNSVVQQRDQRHTTQHSRARFCSTILNKTPAARNMRLTLHKFTRYTK